MTDETPARLDVVIPGAQKAGTSSLADALGGHSRILLHETNEFAPLVRNDLDLDRAVREAYPPDQNAKLRLAKSAGALHASESLSRLKQHNPRVRLIVMLRDPVRRMYSAYWFARRTGDESSSSFAEALERGERLDVPVHRRFWLAYRERSRYLEPLRTCVDLFGRNQVKIVVLEQYARARQSTLDDIQDWLEIGIEDLSSNDQVKNPAQMARSTRIARLARSNGRLIRAARKVLPRRATSTVRRQVLNFINKPAEVPPLDDDVRIALAREFATEKTQLEKEFSLDLSLWE